MIDLTKGRPLTGDEIYIYFVSGDAAYFGTAKMHAFEDCTHLRNWIPAGHKVLRVSGWKQPKVITRDTLRSVEDYKSFKSTICKTCLKKLG